MKIVTLIAACLCLTLASACQTAPKDPDIESFRRAQNEAYFAEAYTAIDQLRGKGQAERALADHLVQVLRAIDPNSPRLDIAGATAAVAGVEQILAAGPRIDPSLSATIISPLRDILSEFDPPVLNPPNQQCETPPVLMPKCSSEPIIVDAGAEASSAGRYRTVGEALASLPAESSCKHRIVIEDGLYDTDGLRISRHVTLEGAEGVNPRLIGGLEIVAPVSVTLKNLVVLGAGTAGVRAANQCVSLALYDARISASENYGVHQGGGRLIASGLEIDRTTRGDSTESAGLFIENGVAALIVDAQFHYNEGAGVLMEGADTRLWARDLVIAGTDVPTADVNVCDASSNNADAFGGVVARDGASADIHASLERNDVVGLHAHSGGRIRLGRGEIRDTITLRDPACGPFENSGFGGVGALADRGGGISLIHFDIDNSGLCGVSVSAGSELDARGGVIRNNPIGACLRAPGFDVRRIAEEVIFLNNERNVDASGLPIPDPELPEF